MQNERTALSPALSGSRGTTNTCCLFAFDAGWCDTHTHTDCVVLLLLLDAAPLDDLSHSVCLAEILNERDGRGRAHIRAKDGRKRIPLKLRPRPRWATAIPWLSSSGFVRGDANGMQIHTHTHKQRRSMSAGRPAGGRIVTLRNDFSVQLPPLPLARRGGRREFACCLSRSPSTLTVGGDSSSSARGAGETDDRKKI